jgi:glycosyltransferase involved in cell wall biosynthesis
LIESVDTREEISISQRQRILENYPWEHIAARYADVYREALESTESPHVRLEKRLHS